MTTLNHHARQTGKTTRQLQHAPIGAVFICRHEAHARSTRVLARALGREDLEIVGVSWLRARHSNFISHLQLCLCRSRGIPPRRPRAVMFSPAPLATTLVFFSFNP